MVQMMDAGMTMARLNLSHGSLKDNLRLITNYRNARRLRPHKNCAFMVEIRGREIRMSHNLEKGKFIKAIHIQIHMEINTDIPIYINIELH